MDRNDAAPAERGPTPPSGPPRVGRRAALGAGALGAGALGISTLVLPPAAAAASPLGPTLDDGDVLGAYRRSGDVSGTASTYLVLTHTGAVGTDSVYDVEVTSTLTGVETVVVAGGGAGGAGQGGGGGAGGFATPDAPLTLAPGTYRVVVGGGGVAPRIEQASADYSRGGNGRASSITAVSGGTTLTRTSAVGGGGGGAGRDGQRDGADGGSGGGAGGYLEASGGTATPDQGGDGAEPDTVDLRSGGGGGVEAAGGTSNLRRQAAVSTDFRSSDGGDGFDRAEWCTAARSESGPAVGEVYGSGVYLAGGGAGYDNKSGNVNNGGLPGVGGGRGAYGGKSTANETLQDGLPHTGGGGGGLEAFYADGFTTGTSGGRAGHGGSGVVLLRWPTTGNTFPTVSRVS